MPLQLNSTQQGILCQSSRQALQQVFQTLKLHFSQNDWLDSNNRYRANCIQSLEHDIPNQIVRDDLSQYIAASAVLHCADGWSFLGRALSCHACGDSDIARHLGYYAELRAAMSILAAEGIGIFHNDHCVIGANNNQQFVSGPNTHMMAWLALKTWANGADSAEILADIIRPNGLPLKQWLDAFNATSQLRPLGETWLTSWGFDLQRLFDDRVARNEASYRPTRLNGPRSLSGSDSARLMCDLWLQCEPRSLSPFATLDNHLLRLSLDEAYFMITHKKPHEDMTDFRTRIGGMLGRMSVGAHWESFLTRKSDPSNPMIIDEAKKQDSTARPRHHVQVISRATLLLRVATGMSARLLRSSGFTKDDLKFWWKKFGDDHGLWHPASAIDDFGDLWADVATSIENARQWDPGNQNKSIQSWLEEESKTAWSLSGCERIALWGLF